MKSICCLYLCSFALAQVPPLNDKPLTTDQRITIYEEWVAADPASTANKNLLAAAYIQKTRETTDFGYLDRASKIIDEVLAVKKDYEALRLRNLVELNRHHFSKVVEYARQMTRSAPTDPQNWCFLGVASFELGKSGGVREAFQQIVSLRPNLFSYNHMAFYRFITGDIDGGIALMKDAVQAGGRFPENKAWCLVELGNMYFKTGRWTEAERAYRDAIQTFPSSHSAYAGLGSVQAAQGKLADAISSYKRAQSITPMVQYAGALYDLYSALGQKAEARQQSDLVDLVAKLDEAANQKANRTLALIYANQDRNLDKSLELAQADFEIRQDVYTYDALSWALFKKGRYQEARQASGNALKLGTPEAMFFYHAGLIANALGDCSTAKGRLERALQLNSGFDIRQRAIARAELDRLKASPQ